MDNNAGNSSKSMKLAYPSKGLIKLRRCASSALSSTVDTVTCTAEADIAIENKTMED